jgi:hypothetical protein
MPSWKEVNPYSGRDIEEDAPANAVAGGGVSMPPDAMMNKKKKLIDGRTKVYRKHRSKLETSREKRIARMEKKKSAYSESILQPMREFSSDEKL